MKDLPPDFEELADLAWALANDRLPTGDDGRLRELLGSAAANRRAYIKLANLLAALERGAMEGARQGSAPDGRAAVPVPSAVLRPPGLLQCLSGAWLSYAIAVLALGAGLLAAWTWKLPGKADPATGALTLQVVKNVRSATISKTRVGTITRMVECQWANANINADDWLAVELGSKYVLSGGLMEITYRSGVKVVLQGAAVFEVDDRNGGFLRLGAATVLCRAPADGNAEAAGEKGTKALGPLAKPADQRSFCVHVCRPGGVGPVTIRLEDVDLKLSVDRHGGLTTRMLSPAQMFTTPDVTMNVAALDDPSVTVGTAQDHTPCLVVLKRPPAAKKKTPGPSETAVSSGAGDTSHKNRKGG